MLLVLAATTVFAVLASSAAIPRNVSSSHGPLRFTEDGTFQISVFEDLHFGENAWTAWGPAQDVASNMVMTNVLESESQQLVVLNGDLITGENTYLHNSSHYVDRIVEPLVQRGLPWASTYGNHDSEFNLSSKAILAREHLWPNSLTKSMVTAPDAGVTNYYLPVYSATCAPKVCAPELLLWFFDSRGGFYFQQLNASGSQVGRPDWVDQSVVNWFTSTRTALQQHYGKTVPSLAFVHIPTNASLAAQSEVGIKPHYQPGINDDYLLAQQAQGWCADGTNTDACVYGGQDAPFMEALVSTPGLIAVFSGHDHGDTWCYKWKNRLPGMKITGNGLNLCFGQHSGYGGYGSWIRGSRQILVTRETLVNNEVQTWIRNEDKSVTGLVTLNSTYGKDRYPTVPNRMTHLGDIFPGL